MRFRERRNDDSREERPQDPAGDDPSGENLARLNNEGRDFLAAGSGAINRALSRDSEAFLAANRQESGE